MERLFKGNNSSSGVAGIKLDQSMRQLYIFCMTYDKICTDEKVRESYQYEADMSNIDVWRRAFNDSKQIKGLDTLDKKRTWEFCTEPYWREFFMNEFMKNDTILDSMLNNLPLRKIEEPVMHIKLANPEQFFNAGDTIRIGTGENVEFCQIDHLYEYCSNKNYYNGVVLKSPTTKNHKTGYDISILNGENWGKVDGLVDPYSPGSYKKGVTINGKEAYINEPREKLKKMNQRRYMFINTQLKKDQYKQQQVEAATKKAQEDAAKKAQVDAEKVLQEQGKVLLLKIKNECNGKVLNLPTRTEHSVKCLKNILSYLKCIAVDEATKDEVQKLKSKKKGEIVSYIEKYIVEKMNTTTSNIDANASNSDNNNTTMLMNIESNTSNTDDNNTAMRMNIEGDTSYTDDNNTSNNTTMMPMNINANATTRVTWQFLGDAGWEEQEGAIGSRVTYVADQKIYILVRMDVDGNLIVKNEIGNGDLIKRSASSFHLTTTATADVPMNIAN